MRPYLARLTLRPVVAAIAAYLVLACGLTWPLPLHLTSHFTGSPTGDLGVYVWNLWIFDHELVQHGRLPFSTDHVFAYTGGADFTLHNYTPLAGLVAMPLMAWLGVVTTFNVLLIVALMTSGLGVFVLARRSGLPPWCAWLSGAIFMGTPAMTARQSAHFSLLFAVALPLFVAVLLRTCEAPRWRHALALGALVAAATYSDAYYGIYCVLMGLFFLAWRFLRVSPTPMPPSPARHLLDGGMVAVGVLVLWRITTGVTRLQLGPVSIAVDTLYNPMFALVLLVAARAWLIYRPSWRLDDGARVLPRLVGVGFASVGVALVLLGPLLVGLAYRFVQHRLPDTPIYWRSSPRGVDLLSYLIPNPAHPVTGALTRDWLMPPAADAYPEFVAALPLAACLLIALSVRAGAIPRVWAMFTAFFVLLSLGPFIHVAGVNTNVIGPWALLRYVPVIGMARSPSRFAIVAALGFAMMAGFAAQALHRQGAWRVRFAVPVLVLLAVELLPWPRQLHSASVPQVYQLIAASADEQGRLLELPAGIRDGTSSVGNFNAASQFFQTRHGRSLIGGYLSRVSESRKRESRRAPILGALFQLSEDAGPISAEWRSAALASRERFLARSCVRYVVVDRRRASPELERFAVDVLGLVSVHRDDDYELLVPDSPPPCQAPPTRGGRPFRDILRDPEPAGQRP